MVHNNVLSDMARIMTKAQKSGNGDRCLVSPSPEARERLKDALTNLKNTAGDEFRELVKFKLPQRVGLDDGVIYPEDFFPVGTPMNIIRSSARNRAPLRGNVRVVVVLVDFSDQEMAASPEHFDDLFFSTGVIPTGSVREYYDEVTHGLVTITGEVVGPYRLPQTMAQYANNESGLGSVAPNAQTMARDAAQYANADVNFLPYDNDGDGFVDAYVVVHAGPGAESTLNPGHIWSHKWVLGGNPFSADGTQIFAYLTVPEDARIGVCCHELGHLLFGFPDLYDTDQSSEGVGNWCLMGGGSWNGGGDTPAHPCAWAKADQGWVSVTNVTSNSVVNIADVKSSHRVYRLSKDGASGSEYFLIENRQLTGFDSKLPGDGLLIWHIDDSISSNSNEFHPKVALEQADGNGDLQVGSNRGDKGDPYPGSTGNNEFDNDSTPNSNTYANQNSCVAVKNIGPSGPTMQATLNVKCIIGKPLFKDIKDRTKDIIKDKEKEVIKDIIDNNKGNFKDFKEGKELKEPKEFKENKEFKEPKEFKEGKDVKEPKEIIEDKFTDGKLIDTRFENVADQGNIENRLSALERQLAMITPFIGAELRPDLHTSALSQELDLQQRKADADRNRTPTKRRLDTKQTRES